MSGAASVAASGIGAMQRLLESVTGNLANGTSTAYQAFKEHIGPSSYIEVRRPGMPTIDANTKSPYGSYTPVGVVNYGGYRDLTPGKIEQDNNPFHMAIIGSGYFQVLLPNAKGGSNLAYTRAGRFTIKNQKLVMEATGMELSDSITVSPQIDPSTIDIDTSGKVTGMNTTNNNFEDLGQITLYRFDNEQGLQLSDYGLFLETEASGNAEQNIPGEEGTGQIQNRALEGSNVNLYEELLLLNKITKITEACAQCIRYQGKMDDAALEIIRT